MKLASTKVILTNVLVTFVQAAVAFLAVNNWDYNNKVVLAGAAGAGLSVVWNTVIKPYLKERKVL
ncbi:hypothetical protein H0W80_02805 [Candidatus Saccharibacteria bacterium]|nr:hypothetical protein [Candidatus Saccharibacteria bacterium]